MHTILLSLFAQTYGNGTYGGGTYGSSATSSGGGSALANTGLAVAVVITAACSIVFIALLVRFWRKKK